MLVLLASTAGAEAPDSQRAYVLLALGANPAPVVLAGELDGPLERTAAAGGRVEVVTPPAPWLPRARGPLLAIALALLVAAVIVEVWSFRSRPE